MAEIDNYAITNDSKKELLVKQFVHIPCFSFGSKHEHRSEKKILFYAYSESSEISSDTAQLPRL